MEREHTSREFERELKTLRERLLAMAARAERQLGRAIDSLARRDEQSTDEVVAGDLQIDRDELQIDELAFLLLARRQPVASDLRFVMLALKVVTDLERIGDLAVNIVKRQRDLAGLPVSSVHSSLERLGARVLEALKDALDAFVRADAAKAEEVIRRDPEIDALNTEVIEDVISLGASQPGDVVRSLALSSISRYLERIGDHATNIAEMVIYFVRGRDVRHVPY